MTSPSRLLAPAALLAIATGCASTIGGASANMTDVYVLPDVMASGDVGVGCATGEAMGGLVTAFRSYSKKAARGSVVPQLSAGMCLEDDVWEAELDGDRAYFEGEITAVKDARIREQRHHLVAAKRYATAFARLEKYYGLPETVEDCPKLKKDTEQMAYMLGLSSGVLAVLHDMGADGRAGVPLSIPGSVVRGAACLDDDKWWGVPKAMQAAIWALQPDAPGAGDPWATFDASVAKGEAAGVRLSNAFFAQSASTVGKADKLETAIARFAEARTTAGDPAFAMLDEYAALLVQHESDRIWVAARGHRTPFGELGSFPVDEQEPPPLPDLDMGDLFDEPVDETPQD